MTYTVYRLTNNWDRRGNAINRQESVIGQTSDPVTPDSMTDEELLRELLA